MPGSPLLVGNGLINRLLKRLPRWGVLLVRLHRGHGLVTGLFVFLTQVGQSRKIQQRNQPLQHRLDGQLAVQVLQLMFRQCVNGLDRLIQLLGVSHE